MRAWCTAVAAALLVAGCGGSDEGAPPAARDILDTAFARLDGVDSFRMWMEATFAAKREEHMTGTFTMTGDSMLIKARFRYREGRTAPVRLRMLVVDGIGFITSRELRAGLPQGKRWLRYTDDELQQPTLTPSQFIELIGDTPDVEIVGPDVVRSEATTHLRARFSMAELVDRAPEGPLVPRILRFAPQLKDIPIETHLWIDEDDGRLRRYSLEIYERPGADPAAAITADVLAEGVPTDDIVAPPADQVTTESALDATAS